MIRRYFLYAAVIGSIFFFSCGKYDDGPLISVVPKKSRIVNTWEIEKILQGSNEVDIADSLFGNYREYKKDGSVVFTLLNGEELLGDWEFFDKKKYLITRLFTDSGSFVEKGKIMKLKQKELWLQVDYTAYIWDLHFKNKGK